MLNNDLETHLKKTFKSAADMSDNPKFELNTLN